MRRVNGALVLPDGQLLSWGADYTVRVWDAQKQQCAFRFDAAPVGVVPAAKSQLFVGDNLGRVHFMELVENRADSQGRV